MKFSATSSASQPFKQTKAREASSSTETKDRSGGPSAGHRVLSGFGAQVGSLGISQPDFGETQSSGPDQSSQGLPGVASFLGSSPGTQNEPVEVRDQNDEEQPTFEEARAAHRNSLDNLADSRRTEIDPEARVALLDSFQGGFGLSHGESVEYAFGQQTPETQPKIQRFEVNPGGHPPDHLFTAPGDATPEERVRSFVELTTADGLLQTNATLESILDDPNSKIRTINQSQGISPASQAELLSYSLYQRNEDGSLGVSEAGEVIFEGLGLEPAPPGDQNDRIQFVQRATEKIEEIFNQSEVLGPELERHSELSKRLAESGISYVVSAGNDGDYGNYLGDGLQMSPGFDDNIFTNPHNITVGALDNEQIAAFSSDDPEVDFYAQGVGIKVGDSDFEFADGTSFAAPAIADRLDNLRAENPDLGQQELLQLFEGTFGRRLPTAN